MYGMAIAYLILFTFGICAVLYGATVVEENVRMAFVLFGLLGIAFSQAVIVFIIEGELEY